MRNRVRMGLSARVVIAALSLSLVSIGLGTAVSGVAPAVGLSESGLPGNGLSRFSRAESNATVWGARLVADFRTALVSEAEAQTLQFQVPVAEDNRKIVLRWDRVPGDTLTTNKRLANPARLFGGYQIWRSNFETPNAFQLIRTYSTIDTTLHFSSRVGIFADPDSIRVRGCTGVPIPGENFTCDPITGKAVAPFNGFFYYYAITWFEAKGDTIGGSVRWVLYDMQTPSEGRLAEPVQPAVRQVAEAPLLNRVTVVPNPFNPRDPANRQQFGNESRVSFTNLPSPAAVRIYTASGDLVRIIENNDSDGAEDWDLKNGNGEDVVGGIYLYQVETSGGTLNTKGHFVVIR